MALSTTVRKPLGLRVSAEEHAIITRAAEREHRSVDSFVLHAALTATGREAPRLRRSREEILSILSAVQQKVRAANPTGRDLVKELIQECREEASRE